MGGHCLAIDPWFIVEKFKNEAQLIDTARKINDNKPIWLSEKVEQELNYNKNKKIGILGLAYKQNIDDLRESPSIKLANILKEKGYLVYGCEPNTNKKEVDGIKILDLDEIINSTDYLILTVGHKEFLQNKNKIFGKNVYNCIGI